jgi:hypothetical protein
MSEVRGDKSDIRKAANRELSNHCGKECSDICNNGSIAFTRCKEEATGRSYLLLARKTLDSAPPESLHKGGRNATRLQQENPRSWDFHARTRKSPRQKLCVNLQKDKYT